LTKLEAQYLIKNIEINIDGNGTYSSKRISFGKSDKTGLYLCISSSPKSDNAISTLLIMMETNFKINKY
jgi:hypothetical protein